MLTLIGIALPTTAQSASEILDEADHAMYEAKQRGKGSWEFAAVPTEAVTASTS